MRESRLFQKMTLKADEKQQLYVRSQTCVLYYAKNKKRDRSQRKQALWMREVTVSWRCLRELEKPSLSYP